MKSETPDDASDACNDEDDVRAASRAKAHEAAAAPVSMADEAADDAAMLSTDRGPPEAGDMGDRRADRGAEAGGSPGEASAGDASSIAAGMAHVRPDAPAAVRLAKASVLGRMFDSSERWKVGGFIVGERLGSGAMGVVYQARDPELGRDVALKLVDVTASNRGAALAEAQALARLSHPNVVPIYEGDIEGDHVYLVMELVSGDTLQHWVEGRSWREILAVYRDAGRGLAAAHAKGLVHRDFKPSNAMVGRDGVRVIDFGLACEADDPAQAPGKRRGRAGTPFFMAPEIEAGGEVTPAADQYSFCVALADALSRTTPPAPRRIAAALARGRAPRPADRFASMDELLAELDRDPAKAWRRGAAMSAVVVLIGAAAYEMAEWRIRASAEPDPCIAGPAKLDAVWSGQARAAALDRVASLGDYGRSLRPVLARGLEAHRARWVDAYQAACVEQRTGTESNAQVDRRNICLDRGRDGLAAVRDLVVRAAADELEQLPRAVQSLPDTAACSGSSTLILAVDPPPPQRSEAVAQVRKQIARARIAVGAGRYEDGLTIARVAVYDARNLDYPPALAEALAVQGHARMMLPDRRQAAPILEEATRLALAAKDDALAVEAWARRAWAQGTSVGPDGVFAGVEVIDAIAQRTPGAEFARALLYNNLGSVLLGTGDRARARQYLERAVVASGKVTGEGTLELLGLRANVALVLDDRRQADARLAEVAAERARLLGDDHPDALAAAWVRGMTTVDDLRRAAEVLVPACRGRAQHRALVDQTKPCWAEVGVLRWDVGDRAAAIEALEQAVRSGNDGPESAGYLALFRGDAAAAVRNFTDAIAAHPVAPDAPRWAQFPQLALRVGLGRAQRAAGDLAGARRTLEAAVTELAQVVQSFPSSSRERRLGRARVELALAMIASGAGSEEVAPVAEAGLSWLRRVGGAATEIDQLVKVSRTAR